MDGWLTCRDTASVVEVLWQLVAAQSENIYNVLAAYISRSIIRVMTAQAWGLEFNSQWLLSLFSCALMEGSLLIIPSFR